MEMREFVTLPPFLGRAFTGARRLTLGLLPLRREAFQILLCWPILLESLPRWMRPSNTGELFEEITQDILVGIVVIQEEFPRNRGQWRL